MRQGHIENRRARYAGACVKFLPTHLKRRSASKDEFEAEKVASASVLVARMPRRGMASIGCLESKILSGGSIRDVHVSTTARYEVTSVFQEHLTLT
jgi:hypothetical protein